MIRFTPPSVILLHTQQTPCGHLPSNRKAHCHRGPCACPNVADFTDEERQFMVACDNRKRALGRHLGCRDILAVAFSLGYRREPA